MQPFEYVILFFGICLLHGFWRVWYEYQLYKFMAAANGKRGSFHLAKLDADLFIEKLDYYADRALTKKKGGQHATF